MHAELVDMGDIVEVVSDPEVGYVQIFCARKAENSTCIRGDMPLSMRPAVGHVCDASVEGTDHRLAVDQDPDPDFSSAET